MVENEITRSVIGAAIEVHRELGPELLESAYEECLSYELMLRGIEFERQEPVPVVYKERKLECGFRADFFLESRVVVELKVVEEVHPVFQAQLLTYMKLSGARVGLRINFNVTVLKDGISRMIL
ncbi:MAG: GxxExxY protein [Bacteroidota bacterium]